MKKYLCILMAVIVMISVILSSAPIQAATTQTNDIARTRLRSTSTYYQYDAATRTLTISGVGNTPEFNNNASSIPWYEWRTTSIDRVVVEEGVTSIGAYMLYQIRAEEIVLPSTITSIGRYALAYTLGVTEWSFSFGLQSIGNYAFYCCNNLTDIHLPDSLSTIGINAFQNCYSLRSIELPYSLKMVGERAFYNCTGLTSVSYRSMSSKVVFGNHTFLNCPSLTCLDMPANGGCNAGFYGFRDTEHMLDNISMRVYADSEAMAYAIANRIPYTTYDSVDVECGVRYDGVYTDDSEIVTHTYFFTPQVTDVYNIYTTGTTDVRGDVCLGDDLLAENDDISNRNHNFCITLSLNAGVTYTIHAQSLYCQGDYELYVLPDAMASVTASGSATCRVADGTEEDGYRHIPLTDRDMRNVILTVSFANGFSYKTYYASGYYNTRTMRYIDEQEQHHFTCGDNTAHIAVGDEFTVDFTVKVAHGYAEKDVPYTEDEDGYTVSYCILCGAEEYRYNFVPTPALHVTGKCVLADSRYNTYSEEIPYSSAYITVEERRYPINADGTWSINTFGNKYCYIKFRNSYGKNVTIMTYVANESIDYGVVALIGYDINKDGRVNAIDYAIYKRELSDTLPENYWQYGDNFLLN